MPRFTVEEFAAVPLGALQAWLGERHRGGPAPLSDILHAVRAACAMPGDAHLRAVDEYFILDEMYEEFAIGVFGAAVDSRNAACLRWVIDRLPWDCVWKAGPGQRTRLTAFGRDLLYRAAAAGDRETAELLTTDPRRGARPVLDITRSARMMGLEACAAGHGPFMQWLVGRNPDFGPELLDEWIAAARFGGHLELAEQLVAHERVRAPE